MLIKNPYTDFPLDPDITLGGGNAKYKRGISVPDINIDKVLEKSEYVLTLITNKSINIDREYDSISPGEPPTHFTELIQSKIQSIKRRSPGNTKDIGIEKILVLHEDCFKLRRSFVKKLILDKSITEKAITKAANI